MTEFADKIRTIGAPRRTGQSERRPVLNEETGKVGGEQVIHWDGRQDAIVRPETLKVKVSVNG